MPLRKWLIIIALFAGLSLSGCSADPQTATPTPQPSLTPALIAYRTPTPSLTPSGAPATATPFPSATPTPLTYKVGKNDDMFGIAWRFGISVDALKTANPKVHPNYMGEGTLLVIPVTPKPPTPTGAVTGSPRPTAAPISLTAPKCYPDAQDGLWCLALVRNPGHGSLESPSAVFRLLPTGQEKASEQVVYAPLNVLAAGASVPLAAYFPAPIQGRPVVEAQPADSLPLAASDPRYPGVAVQNGKTSLDGRSASVSGEVVPGQGVSSVKQVWLLAVAYDKLGNPVGLRKWESPGSLSVGSPLAFTLNVYSLGPLIDRVEVIAEGHN